MNRSTEGYFETEAGKAVSEIYQYGTNGSYPVPPPPSPNGYAFGIARIPYNDYTARLHEGERVLTAAEARRMDAGSGASVVITGNTFVVRDESDIDLIAETICERLKEAEAIYAR